MVVSVTCLMVTECLVGIFERLVGLVKTRMISEHVVHHTFPLVGQKDSQITSYHKQAECMNCTDDRIAIMFERDQPLFNIRLKLFGNHTIEGDNQNITSGCSEPVWVENSFDAPDKAESFSRSRPRFHPNCLRV
jgi:hypothetical protein